MISEVNQEFEELYNENYQKVYQLAMTLTGNSHDAEEITQEAFLRAFRSFPAFKKECSFFTWIYRITLNTANSCMKKRTKLPVLVMTEDYGYKLEQLIDTEPSNDPESKLLSKELQYNCLHCLTECMPMMQRKVFCLAIGIGLPQKIIAEVLECSLSSVKTNLHRAKKRWAGYMEDRCSYIKEDNPCHCSQWVKIALRNGWISQENAHEYKPDIPMNMHSRKDIMELKNLRDSYNALWCRKPDEIQVKRIKEGIRNKEWKVLA